MQTTFLFPEPSLSSLFCSDSTGREWEAGVTPKQHPAHPTAPQADLGQQGLQPPPEGSVLPAQLLVVGQHGLQPRLQPLQVLLLLPPGLAGRLPVLDHPLLPLQQLCLGTRGHGVSRGEAARDRLVVPRG